MRCQQKVQGGLNPLGTNIVAKKTLATTDGEVSSGKGSRYLTGWRHIFIESRHFQSI